MYKNLWAWIFFYGNIIVTLVVCCVLIDKKRLKDLVPVGLFIGVENYTVDMLGLYFGYWSYPLDNPGYPEIPIISSIIYFPIIAMIYYQYLSKNLGKNIILTSGFVMLNMIIEIITVKTTDIFIYHKGMNLFVAFLFYLMAYILIISFGRIYRKL